MASAAFQEALKVVKQWTSIVGTGGEKMTFPPQLRGGSLIIPRLPDKNEGQETRRSYLKTRKTCSFRRKIEG